jgi:ribosomal protein L11 methyltransferase
VSAPPLVRLGVRVPAAEAERALALLLPVLGGGAEERVVGEEVVEYALYGEPDALPDRALLRSLLGDALVGVTSSPVAGGWERRWHEFLRPATVDGMTVRAPWVPGAAGDLVIDPGTCFGAGTHATTRLCLALLLGSRPAGALCDWGAGSGVLAVAAARLGWAPVTAVEVDPGAADVIRANAAASGAAVDVVTLDLLAGAPSAPTVVANLTFDVLIALAGALERAPSRLLAAGFLAERAGEVADAFAAAGLREAARREEDGWAALELVAPPVAA